MRLSPLRSLALLCALVVAAACSPESRGERGSAAEPGGDLRVERLPLDLDFGVDMAWERDTDRFFVTEKNSGKIRVVVDGRLVPKPCARVRSSATFLEGLTGIVLHPRFEENRWLYVYYTNKEPHENRVTRFTVRDNDCTDPEDVISGIEPSREHNGGQMVFAGDKLFVTTGDASKPRLSQDLDRPEGKILRFNDDGSIPEDNPFSAPGAPSPIWSYGHRNPFGLAYRADREQLFSTENGPECDDELNLIEPGRNYGWGQNYECGTDGVGREPTGPVVRWPVPIVPTDLWWYEGRIESLQGALLMTEFREGKVHRLEMSDDGRDVLSQEVIYSGEDKVADVSEGPGGWLYLVARGSVFRITDEGG